MKKKSLAILLCLVMAVSLMTGCGGSKTSGSSEKPADSSTEASAETPKEYGVLRVGMMPFGINVPAQYALDHGVSADNLYQRRCEQNRNHIRQT